MAISTERRTAATPVQVVSPGGRQRWRSPGLGILMALATASTIFWQLGRPALWLDEAATSTGIHRDWHHLAHLIRGTDAPLVPYYAFLKAVTEATTTVFPAMADHPELLLRLPSLAAFTAAGWILIAWLARRASVPVVVGTGAAFVLAVSTSRYGQEARSYGLIVLAAILSTVIWGWVVAPGRRRAWVLLYAASVSAIVLLNPLAATIVAAHGLVALTLGRSSGGHRLGAALRTGIGAALGGAAVAPLALTMLKNGGGATKFPALTYENLLHAFRELFTSDPSPRFGIGYIVILSLIGATQVFSKENGVVARLALAWAVVPPLLLLPALFVKPNLLLGRYLLFTVPAWCVLAGLGLGVLAGAVRYRPVAALLVVAVVGGLAYTQLPSLKNERLPNAHGPDPRFALSVADRHPDLPIIPSTRYLAIQIAAYGQGDRLLGIHPQYTEADIWPVWDPAADRREIFRAGSEAVLIMRPDAKAPGCGHESVLLPTYFAAQCMPKVLRQLDYQVLSYRSGGEGYGVAIIERPSPLKPRRALPAT